jgi:hypothetical protein
MVAAILFYHMSIQAKIDPDGHFKIPHLWPPENPPPEAGTYPLGERAN